MQTMTQIARARRAAAVEALSRKDANLFAERRCERPAALVLGAGR
ncbi:MAG: hypothetical protein AAFQ54_07085 [Pseudomonadota bacterium]